jgi:transcription factor IIIB subunit 2
MILTDREVALKTKIWYNANKDYLEEMAVRRVLESNKNYSHRKGKSSKKKKLPPPSTPAEAAKQLLMNKKLSKKINQAVFDDMFESAESIAKIKQRDAIMKINGVSNASTPTIAPVYEVVEEPGDIPDPNAKKTNEGSDDEDEGKAAEVVEEDDDEEMDSDDMADDERLLRDARAKYTFGDDDDEPEYYDEEDY